jgi:ubiquitin-activating enzyme E1
LNGYVQPVIPFVTDTYSNTVNPPSEKSFPVCTIKNFPNEIIHTVYWALDQFELFKHGPQMFNSWINNKTIEITKELWLFGTKKNFIVWALDIFHEYFDYQISELLKAYPETTLTKDDQLFWSGEKICPKQIKFDIKQHYVFIELTVNLLSKCYNETCDFTYEDLSNVLKDYEYIPIAKDYVYNLDKNIVANTLHPLEFNKNDETIINWIYSISNLRATNYSIKNEDFSMIKGIACKIIPSVITTASLVAGLATIEMIKYLSNCDNYTRTCVDLGINVFTSSKPNEAKSIIIAGKEFNFWYKFIEKDDLSIENFIDKYNKLFETNISMISLGSSLIYADFMDGEKSLKLSEIVKEHSSNILTISSDDESVDLPEIQIIL